MTDKVVVLVTAAKLRDCRKIARFLVDARLAACVNITTPVRSVYRWQGKVVEEKEYLMLIKSRRPLFRRLEKAIHELHPYQIPEIICLPVTEGSRKYLRWIEENAR